MDGRIAGHTFLNGICMAERPDGLPCLRRWVDIRHFGMCDIDAQGVAHIGGLNLYEARDIEENRQKQDEAIASASGRRVKEQEAA